MNKSEILKVAKPILFNTEMVRAILDGRKTMTRRVIKAPYDLRQYEFYKLHDNSDGRITTGKDKLCAGFYTEQQIFYVDGEKHIDAHYYVSPYKPGNFLYVRETWQYAYDMDDYDQIIENTGRYLYRADNPMPFSHWIDSSTGDYKDSMPWRPSIHMPKEAARIFLKVTEVRVERLQEMTIDDCLHEGASILKGFEDFIKIWNSTIKKQYLDKYGWEGSPWVWVVEFERVEVDG